ncbi:MAG: hypothetical protein HS124_06900 [Anaerolineales bacterium]|nr:hypothetical protein [Anaerolineales bacterium]
MEEAHPFAGMSQVNEYAAGVDIGAEEIVVCVAGDGNMQIVKPSATIRWTCRTSGNGCRSIK